MLKPKHLALAALLFSGLISVLSMPATAAPADNQKPLIFFIDELDRCRPDYALQLLEKAKHLFNIDGIIFILALDRDQIGHSLKSIYGEGLDVDGYLRRRVRARGLQPRQRMSGQAAGRGRSGRQPGRLPYKRRTGRRMGFRRS